ncbi:hypothetical protein [Poriferisphaera sp. WC338]|uniref:hypothetical protein n=1 Tax=Poriferisphaera sp. WC338 TaxID=3425129 RepID=UPI003D8194C3
MLNLKSKYCGWKLMIVIMLGFSTFNLPVMAQLGTPLENHRELNANTTGEGSAYEQKQVKLKSLSMLNELMHEESRRTTTRIRQIRQYMQEKNLLTDYETAASRMTLPGSKRELTYDDASLATLNVLRSNPESVANAIELTANLTNAQLATDIRAYDAVNPPLWRQMRREQKEVARMQQFLEEKKDWDDYISWAKREFASAPNRDHSQVTDIEPNQLGEMEREEMLVSLSRDRHIEQERQARLEALRQQLGKVQQRKSEVVGQSNTPKDDIDHRQQSMSMYWDDQFEDIPNSTGRPMPYMPMNQRMHQGMAQGMQSMNAGAMPMSEREAEMNAAAEPSATQPATQESNVQNKIPIELQERIQQSDTDNMPQDQP